jgi:hypothetical protein
LWWAPARWRFPERGLGSTLDFAFLSDKFPNTFGTTSPSTRWPRHDGAKSWPRNSILRRPDKHAADPKQAQKPDKDIHSKLDKGLEGTFPASDPAASTEPKPDVR